MTLDLIVPLAFGICALTGLVLHSYVVHRGRLAEETLIRERQDMTPPLARTAD